MSTPRRKLAAIVFADIAGYTDKANQDEAAALTVRDRVERLIKASTISHNGRIVKTMGDGAMLEFTSAVEAVSCAIDIQDQMEHLNEELGLPEPIAVRVGVHVGDVVEEDNDLYGNAVNIASRVHAMAKPGGICITREVYVQIRPILKLQCMPVPGGSSDRMPEKVEVFAVLGEEGAPGAETLKASRKTLLFAGIGAVVLAGIAFGILNAKIRSAATSDAIGGITTEQAHRILLPDWVTPGEWFALDAGSQATELAVYFGNRKANAKVENGRLLVQTPADLPTEQTTIAVFQGNGQDALMRQQTQVIRYGALAMHTTRPSTTSTEPGPGVNIDSRPAQTDTKTAAPTAKPAAPVSKPGATEPKSSPDAPKPPAAPATIVRMPELGANEDYNTLVSSIGSDKPLPMRYEFKELQKLPEEMGQAMKAMQLARTGNKDEAQQILKNVRISLKDADEGVAVETESILKTVDALISEGDKGKVVFGAHPKFAEAFAFSVNRGTRNLPGLMFVERQIKDGKFVEAQRALEVLRKRPDLTKGEQKAVARLQERIETKDKPKLPPVPGTPEP